MRIKAVYPSTFMKITCPNCGSEGTLRTEKTPEQDFSVFCPQCEEKFLVKIDHRKFYRKGISIPIKYTLLGRESINQDIKSGKIVDISMEGIGVESFIHEYSPEFHKEGNLYRLSFSLPPKHIPIKISGKVINIRRVDSGINFNLGIIFLDLDSFSRKEIGFFLMPE